MVFGSPKTTKLNAFIHINKEINKKGEDGRKGGEEMKGKKGKSKEFKRKRTIEHKMLEA